MSKKGKSKDKDIETYDFTLNHRCRSCGFFYAQSILVFTERTEYQTEIKPRCGRTPEMVVLESNRCPCQYFKDGSAVPSPPKPEPPKAAIDAASPRPYDHELFNDDGTLRLWKIITEDVVEDFVHIVAPGEHIKEIDLRVRLRTELNKLVRDLGDGFNPKSETDDGEENE